MVRETSKKLAMTTNTHNAVLDSAILARFLNRSRNNTATVFLYYLRLLDLLTRYAMLGHRKTSIAKQFITILFPGLYCCFSHVAMAESTEVQGTTSSNNNYVAIAVTPAAQVSTAAPAAQEAWNVLGPVSYTHLTLPTNSEV